MKKMIKRMCVSVLALMVAAGSLIGSYGIEAHADDALPQERILLDDDAGEMQEYAAKELQKYLYQLFGTWLLRGIRQRQRGLSRQGILGRTMGGKRL